MKTFTNYAEKKAKQFFNLLQGYTKSIRLTAILILLLMGVSNAWANQYWYRGNKHSNWGTAKAFSVSTDGYYEYIDGTYNGVHQFKICLNSNNYNNALGRQYTNSGFNGTNITNMNSASSRWKENNGENAEDNVCIYNGNDNTYYIIVYYPNTDINASSDPIICASTTLPKSWTVVYNGNGNTGGSVPTDNTVYANNASVTVKGNTGNLTKTGYTFSGWNTNADGSGTNRDANSTFKITAHTTLYAKWTETETKHEVTISYKYGNTSIKSDDKQSVGESTEVSITAPTITGYTFTGWTLGTGITNHSANTKTNPISITTKSSGSGYTLIANFTKNSYTFNLVQAEGGNATATVNGNAISSPATLEHGTQITLNATADDKYKFSKWVDENGEQLSTANPYPHIPLMQMQQ